MKKIALALSLLVGCASNAPSRELIDARAAYEKAAGGNAARLVPAELHVAKTALDKAENESSDESDSAAARDLSYVAMRKAQRAEALGNAAAANAAAAGLKEERTKTQEDIIAAQRGQLRGAETALERQQRELAEKEGQLTQTKQTAEQERQARVAAEAKAADADKKAKEAMDALSRQLAVKDESRGTVITLSGGVLFATNKAQLLPGATAQLDKVADALKTQAERHFTVEGHTDSQGTAAVNADLSARRANAVRDYLITRGVSADAISAQGFGSQRPIGDNKSTEGRAMNRRVEIIVDRGASPNAAAAK